MSEFADKVVLHLQNLPHEIQPGKNPRWTENAIRRAIELAQGGK